MFKYGGFFSYRDFLNGYSGQDFMGLAQCIFVVAATLFIVLACIFLRKADRKRIGTFLKVMGVIIPVLDALQIALESYYDIKCGKGFSFATLLPLYTCSIFVYALPMAAYGKGRIREYSLSFLTTLGIFAGLTNFFMPPVLKTYPFFHFRSLVSLHLHFMMVFIGIFLIASGYHVPKWADIFKTMVHVAILSVFALPVNYLLSSYYGVSVDYMLYHSGKGAPLLPDLAEKLATYGLRPLFSLLIFAVYIILTTAVVAIVRLIIHLKEKSAKKREV